jgi:hypothetical protein
MVAQAIMAVQTARSEPLGRFRRSQTRALVQGLYALLVPLKCRLGRLGLAVRPPIRTALPFKQ